MKREEKDKVIQSTTINILLALSFAILLLYIYRGFHDAGAITKIADFTWYGGTTLVVLGLLSLAAAAIRKLKKIVRYGVFSLITGASLIMMNYAFLVSRVAFGNYLYYSLLILTALYTIAAIVLTWNRVRAD